MRRRFSILFFLFLLVGLSCNLPLPAFLGGLSPTLTPTSTIIPSPTTPPTPTPSPTPLPAIRVAQADQSTLEGNFDQAVQQNTIALDVAGDDKTRSAALFGIGKAQFLAGDCPASIQTFNSLVEKYPSSEILPGAHYFLGQCYRKQGNSSKAVESFHKYLDLRPGVLDAYLQELIGDILTESKDNAGAAAAYQSAIKAPQLGNTRPIEIKLGKLASSSGDHEQAIRYFMSVYEATQNDYVKAQMDYLLGQSYLAIGMPEQAYTRFKDAVSNYPKAYDAYLSLVALVGNNIQVSDLDRGLVDYYAGQYGVAVDAFDRYIHNHPDHDGTPHYYKGLSLRTLGENDRAIAEWDSLIKDHPDDRFYAAAFDEKSYTQWTSQEKYKEASQTLLNYINHNQKTDQSPGFLFEAARILERGGDLQGAANLWERLLNDYPSAENSYRAIFLAGISYYRMEQYDHALTIFQRALVLASNPDDQAMANFWIGKTQEARNNPAAAKQAWEAAAQNSPGSYYGERARDLLSKIAPFDVQSPINLNWDPVKERHLADLWMRSTFNLPENTDLTGLGSLQNDPRIQRGDAFWELGLYSDAYDEFESVRQEISADPGNNFRLMNHLLDLGFYQPAILTSRQILTLANLNDNDTFSAPDYFNHIRFGPYYSNVVLDASSKEGLNPLFLLSVIRQESMFGSFAESSAGAVGLMQLMPATGQEIANQLNWPPNYDVSDLNLPDVNIRLGANYLSRWRNHFGEVIYALAAYNGGPGNAQIWKDLAKDDPDLFLEVIRASETRTYIMQIAEFMHIYERLYAPGR